MLEKAHLKAPSNFLNGEVPSLGYRIPINVGRAMSLDALFLATLTLYQMRNNRIKPSPSHPPPSNSGSAVGSLLASTSLPNCSDLDPGQRRGRVPDERLCHLWIGVLWEQLAVIQQGPTGAPPEALRQRLWRGGLSPGRKARLQVGAPIAGVARSGVEPLPPAVWGRGLRRDLGVLPLEVAPAARSAG
jgi:hypothetical protein